MSAPETRILLIEDNPGDVRLIQSMLEQACGATVQIETAGRLAVGLARLAQGGIDVVLLDLGLPDSTGLETVQMTQACAPLIPIVVLTCCEDEGLGARSVLAGAQDYLVKGATDGALLWRSIRYAMGRHALMDQGRHQSFIDQVTGLYNLRGFFTLASRELKLAERRNESMTLVVAAPLGFNEIMLAFGPQRAYALLAQAADILRQTYRETDIFARTGAGELAVLAIGAHPDVAPTLITRFRKEAKSGGATEASPNKLLLHTGVCVWEPKNPVPIGDLLAKARQAMKPGLMPPPKTGWPDPAPAPPET
ncbi:MAG: diguanylate cyclase [Planctomycetes bacterium]|nr:diguanylate cyclase [Planctomycetota bacterium]